MAEGLEFTEDSLAVTLHWNGLSNVFGHEVLYDSERIIVGWVLKLFQNFNIDILGAYVFLDVI